MPDFDIDPVAAPTQVEPAAKPPADELPEALKGKTPAQIAAIATQESQEKAALASQLADQNERYNKLAMAALTATNTAPAADDPKEDPLPDAEEDPAAHTAAIIRKTVAEEMAKTVKPLAESFQQSQAVALAGSIEAQKHTMHTAVKEDGTLKYPNWSAVEKSVMDILNQYNPQVAASPGAMEEMYFREVGKRVATGDTSFTPVLTTPSPLETGGRGSHTMRDNDYAPPGEQQRLSDAGRVFAQRSRMGESEFQGYQGKGSMSLEDHQAIQAKLKKRTA